MDKRVADVSVVADADGVVVAHRALRVNAAGSFKEALNNKHNSKK